MQAGTSHFLGQNFAKAFEVKFLNDNNVEDYVWATSWGVSTRLVGALIMTHSDDDGLVLPPKLAPIQVVIVPIPKPSEKLTEYAEKLAVELRDKGISVKIDNDDKNRPGFKFAEYEMKGIPVRVGIGMRDIENGVFEIARRDTKEKQSVKIESASEYIDNLLEEIQNNLYQRAIDFRKENSTSVDNFEDFKKVLKEKGGFVFAHWDGTAETEEKIKELTKATIRCIPLDAKEEQGVDMITGKPSKIRVLFAKAY